MRKKSASTATKKVAAAKKKRRAAAKSSPRILEPGEEIRLSLRIHNQFAHYDQRKLKEEGPSRPIEGIILSIREIATGQLVPLASGDYGDYVLEVLHNRSFDPGFASTQNAPKQSAGERFRVGSPWERVKRLLRQMAAERKLVSLSDGSLSSSSLAQVLDGWRVVKVRADQIEADE